MNLCGTRDGQNHESLWNRVVHFSVFQSVGPVHLRISRLNHTEKLSRNRRLQENKESSNIFLMRLQYFPPFFSPIQCLPELMLQGPRTDVLRTDRTRRQTSIRRYLSVGDLTEILTVQKSRFPLLIPT